MVRFFNILSLVLSILTGLSAQRQEMLFFHYTMNLEIGFSANGSSCLLQDNNGFIWIGTHDGLNHFDGYKAKVYRYEPGKRGTLSGNSITCLFEDKSGIIWVGTKSNGLNRYNPYTDFFSTYRHGYDDAETISSDRITVIFEDQHQNLWIGTDNGLNFFDRRRQKFKLYKNGTNQNYVISVNEDSSGNIWIGMNLGMYLFNRDKEEFISFEDYFSLNHKLDKYALHLCVIDRDGTFWIGAHKDLIRFNPNTNGFTQYTMDMDFNLNESYNFVQTIFLDRSKRGAFLWIGSHDGLYKFDINTETFRSFRNSALNDYSISHNSIKAILKDKSGCLWIGCENKGLNKVNTNRYFIRHYIPNPLNWSSQENDIKRLFLAKSGKLWIATPGGLLVFDKHKFF